MSREEFIKRLEEEGLYSVPNSEHLWKHDMFIIRILRNLDMFVTENNGYTFDELEQFLLDKGIVEPNFDAHEYLIERGFKNKSPNTFIKDDSGISLSLYTSQKYICIRKYPENFYWGLTGLTKQSIDKAIKLIDFLIELDQSNE